MLASSLPALLLQMTTPWQRQAELGGAPSGSTCCMDPRYFITEFLNLWGKKNHKYHRENILELTVSYIYVNLHFLIYIVMYSFMYIQAINILLSQFMFLYLILVF